jgi:hypothetical protein
MDIKTDVAICTSKAITNGAAIERKLKMDKPTIQIQFPTNYKWVLFLNISSK